MASDFGQQLPGVILNDRYATISALNHGSFGAVSMARDTKTGQTVALKCLLKPSAGLGLDSGIQVDDRSEELKIHTRVRSHPNIVNLLDSFETSHNSYLVLEYCSMGDLYEAIRQEKGPKQTDHVRSFMFQLINAVEILHLKGISHRDIKPENIFLTESGDMKLGDFGLATTDSWSYDIAVGSDRYMAPEQFDPQGQGLSTAKADIWSIGICLLNILFARNPFGEPAMSDPLFADFARDRQSLFDVFPNLSQDTFEVLIHCLALDPEKRSLQNMRAALERVVSFTTDDESLDDFCTENRDVVRATFNREPLRTPSIVSPAIDQSKGFPWAQALHMSSPQAQGRTLSVIPDNDSYSEDLFPGSEKSHIDWLSKADTQSVESMGDSGLGVSIPSMTNVALGSVNASSKPLPIAGSLPAFGGRAGNALSSIFGRKKSTFESKSWSDMWDEEQEELAEQKQTKADNNAVRSRVSQLSQDSESDGHSTPRAPFAEIKNPSVTIRPVTSAKNDSKTSHRDFAPAPRYSPPSKRSIIDKWAALGEKRRNPGESLRDNPTESAKKRFSPSTWRRNFNNYRNNQKLDHSVWKKQEWNRSTDWRRSDQNLSQMSPLHPSQLDGACDSDSSDFEIELDHGDDGPEWVGGWKDLHL
ncbi:MAG: hypothetical protein Q9159_006153 [Coniocarpon cinnabarinum]